jgi:hypothetical protein
VLTEAPAAAPRPKRVQGKAKPATVPAQAPVVKDVAAKVEPAVASTVDIVNPETAVEPKTAEINAEAGAETQAPTQQD